MNKVGKMSNTGQRGRADRKKAGRKAKAPAIDRRAARTRTALHEALMSLIVHKGYDELSVSDIANEANVGRATFYCHFTSKDDLLRNSAGWMRAMLLEQRERAAAAEGSSAAKLLGFSPFLFEHTREQLPLYRAVVRGRAGAIILDKLRGILAEFVREDLAASRGPQPSQALAREVTVQYLVGGFMSVLTAWLDRGAKESPEQMDAAFRSLVLHGLSKDLLADEKARRAPAGRIRASGPMV